MCESLGTSCNVVLLCVKEGTRNDRRENVGGGGGKVGGTSAETRGGGGRWARAER